MQKSDNTNKSFGLLSVHERIKLYFGNEYGVSIHSMPGEGTTIEVRLPKHFKGEEDNVSGIDCR
jgi:two-component system sensor histidine kinase YesM